MDPNRLALLRQLLGEYQHAAQAAQLQQYANQSPIATGWVQTPITQMPTSYIGREELGEVVSRVETVRQQLLATMMRLVTRMDEQEARIARMEALLLALSAADETKSETKEESDGGE